MKWSIPTVLILFNALIAPCITPMPQPAPVTSTAPGPVTEQTMAQEPDPGPVNTTLYVLMYHHLIREGEPYNNWMLTDVRFREDLEWLASHGYTTVLPCQLAAGERLPPRAVMLTFDDGYDSNYYMAYPLLQEFNAKAAIALITSHVEDQDAGYLTWDMCREMAQSGLVEFGSHTHALHGSEYGSVKRGVTDTQEEYNQRVFSDVQRSIDLIEDRVGTEVTFFAYPRGDTDPWFNSYLREHFDLSVTSRRGSSDISNGLYDLNRFVISMQMRPSDILPD